MFVRLVFLIFLICQFGISKGIKYGEFVSAVKENFQEEPTFFAYSKEFPYMIEVLHNDVHICGGVLIKWNAVLSAAHCFPKDINDIIFENYKVLAGNQLLEDQIGPMVQIRKVKTIVFHHKFDLPKRDAALIRSDRNFIETDYVKLIRLPEGYETYSFKGVDVVQLGWGVTEKNQLSSVLLKSKARVTIYRNCVNMWYREFKPYQHMLLCVQGLGMTVTCGGDSGGPTVIHNKNNPSLDILVGITSGGFDDDQGCKAGTPTLVLNVVSVLDWINRITNIYKTSINKS